MTNNQPLRDELARLSRERDEIELEVEAASSRLRAAGVGMDKPLVDAEVKKEGGVDCIGSLETTRSIDGRRTTTTNDGVERKLNLNTPPSTKKTKTNKKLQGFPLPNLDLAAIRGDRHLVITRMNDHKALTSRVEEAVRRLLEERRAEEGAPAAEASADATAAPGAAPVQARPAAAAAAAATASLNRLVPFARVDDVAPSSPAEEAGMMRGDRVVSFGSVSVSASSSSASSSSAAAAASSPSAPAPLTRLPGEVAAALASGGSIDVVVLRAGGGGGGAGSGGRGGAGSETAAAAVAAVREVSLRLTPREGWGGRGALGCHLKPL